MKSFFEAKKIAVIGASRNREKVGNVVFRNLLENNKLKVFPVNPNADYVENVKAYSDVLAIPFIVDMAIIAVPAALVPEVLESCGKKGVNKIIIISAGFSEAGNFELARKVDEITKKYKIKFLGPNVLGIVNPYKNMNASFFHDVPEKGSVGVISQSGAVGTSILDEALENKLGISAFIPLGNMQGEDFISALDYFGNDVYTDVIIMYIESLKDASGKDFVELARKITKKKYIIALKSGKTEQGMEAARTHTASLSSSSKIYSGAFKQAGIIEVDSLEDMMFLAKFLSKYKRNGKKAGIITNAGGLGVLAVDTLVKAGMEIPEIPENVLKELDSFLPPGYSRRNPLDILGDALAERYEKTLRVLSRHNLFDVFIVILSPQEMTQPMETAEILINRSKPVIACLIGGLSFIEAKKLIKENGGIVCNDISEIGILGRVIPRD